MRLPAQAARQALMAPRRDVATLDRVRAAAPVPAAVARRAGWLALRQAAESARPAAVVSAQVAAARPAASARATVLPAVVPVSAARAMAQAAAARRVAAAAGQGAAAPGSPAEAVV